MHFLKICVGILKNFFINNLIYVYVILNYNH